tara:strand:+ start:350 stop:799 length:450 start_codon:yes stop_codon:yes gene_type:complete
MKKIFFSVKILFIYFIFVTPGLSAKSQNFEKGKALFEEKKFEESKIFFEKDIVYNPKSESSYLFLAKIYNKNENDEAEEVNLNNVLLLNPQNDEAIYMLSLLKIKRSDYNGAKNLIKQFSLVCKNFCSKKEEMEEKFNKLTPENEADNN